MRMHPLIAALLLGLTVSPVAVQAAPMAHHHHAAKAAVASPSTQAYQQAMERMHAAMNQPLSGNPDVDFVRQMIPHHQGAVEMARIQLAYGHDEALKAFSRWIITIQEIEIGYMQQWLRGRDNGLAQPGAKDYYGDAMQTMHHSMMIDYTGDADVDFVRGMIPHHQGAVDMAAILTAEGSNPDIRALADGVFRSQSYEIAWQRQWLEHCSRPTRFPSLIF